MNENEDVRDCLRALAQALPRDAGPSVERTLLVRFRERRDNKRRWAYVAGMAASVAILAGLYVAMWHSRSTIQSGSPSEADQTPGFITLPYAQSGVPLEQPVIVRVSLPVSELGMMGVPFSPTSTKERVRVDLLVGQDGVARAVRLVE
jgi:hypothetical protein